MIIKFIFDRVVAAIGLLCLWPLLLVVAILIKLKMPGGPVIFTQQRVGKDGKLFTCHKFRSMMVARSAPNENENENENGRGARGKSEVANATRRFHRFEQISQINENENGAQSATKTITKTKTAGAVRGEDVESSEGGGWSTVSVAGDKRITPFGATLRHYKLDELPGLWDVMIGNMSFVGPRPDVPGYADKLKGADRDVLKLRPAITGPATMKYRREDEMLADVRRLVEEGRGKMDD